MKCPAIDLYGDLLQIQSCWDCIYLSYKILWHLSTSLYFKERLIHSQWKQQVRMVWKRKGSMSHVLQSLCSFSYMVLVGLIEKSFFFFFFSFPSEFPCLFLSCYSGLAPLEHLSSWPTSFLLNLLSPSPCVPAASFSFTFIFLVIASLYIFIAFIPITPSLPLLVTPLDQWAPHVSRT